MRNQLFVVLSSKGLACEDTSRLLKLLWKFKIPVIPTLQNSEVAEFLWALAVGRFGNRKDHGHPLLLVKNEMGEVIWACAEPTEEQIREAIGLDGTIP